jgi:DNA-binding NarL/FixJ family response regulator
MTDPLGVLIVDDHEVVHWGLRIMLTGQPWIGRCDSAADGAQAVTLARRHQPDVALVDLFVGGESGAEICERLHAVRPGLKVLLISGAGRISPGAATACGASGFVTKDARGADIVRAVHRVASGEQVFDEAEPEGIDLTARERDILSLLATGATNREIAERLYLSPHTVKEYVSALYRKLSVRNRSEAVRRAAALGLAA